MRALTCGRYALGSWHRATGHTRLPFVSIPVVSLPELSNQACSSTQCSISQLSRRGFAALRSGASFGGDGGEAGAGSSGPEEPTVIELEGSEAMDMSDLPMQGRSVIELYRDCIRLTHHIGGRSVKVSSIKSSAKYEGLGAISLARSGVRARLPFFSRHSSSLSSSSPRSSSHFSSLVLRQF